MKVKQLIEQLQKFDPEMPVVYRKSVDNGGFIDFELHEPCEFYPGGLCCLSSQHPFTGNVDGIVRAGKETKDVESTKEM
ncbi:hypothetical protein MASR1M48_17160 [Lactococcus petauri]